VVQCFPAAAVIDRSLKAAQNRYKQDTGRGGIGWLARTIVNFKITTESDNTVRPRKVIRKFAKQNNPTAMSQEQGAKKKKTNSWPSSAVGDVKFRMGNSRRFAKLLPCHCQYQAGTNFRFITLLSTAFCLLYY